MWAASGPENVGRARSRSRGRADGGAISEAAEITPRAAARIVPVCTRVRIGAGRKWAITGLTVPASRIRVGPYQ
jgi:hypothetical protein